MGEGATGSVYLAADLKKGSEQISGHLAKE